MKIRHVCKLLAVFGLIFLFASVAWAAAHGKEKTRKTGILLVAFGSSEASAQVSFDNIERKVMSAYPDVPVRWAYTSSIIRRKLAGQGRQLDSPEVALARMQDEGFTHVAVQSLHTIAGKEFHDLRRTVTAFQMMGEMERVLLGNPLLATQEDMERAVEGILALIPAQRKKDEAVVLMGHGTHHPSNAFYAALMFQVQRRDPNIFIGCVEGYPEIGDIQTMLNENRIRKVYLMPFMSVAGDHAKNDLAGEEPDSWMSVLTAAGFACEVVLKGTAEFDAFADIWVGHIADPMGRF
ncbi:MAG: sirohydrochlorin cobaltochelatase [Desulfobacterales bacterium]